MQHPQRANRGFTLVELAIVLIILGLLAGGIMAGTALIRSSNITASVTDYNRYAAATKAFLDKYNYLPGDIPNATEFWGAADNGDGTGADCISVASSDFKTCNGNGNGDIGNYDAGVSVECYRAWQHLAAAGFISGRFLGTNGAGTSDWNSTPGTNVPKGRLPKSGFALHGATSPVSTTVTYFGGFPYQNRLMFGQATTNGSVIGSLLTPTEMMNIDTKIDDGRPGSGTIMAPPGSGTTTPACSTTTDYRTAEYDRTVNEEVCIIIGQPKLQ